MLNKIRLSEIKKKKRGGGTGTVGILITSPELEARIKIALTRAYMPDSFCY